MSQHGRQRKSRATWLSRPSTKNSKSFSPYSRSLHVEQLEERWLLAADLVVLDVWTVPGSIDVDESFRIKARIKNVGNSNANAGLFANQEAVFYFDGVQKGEGDDYDNLGPGETLVVQSPSISTSTPGSHSIRAVADGNNEVSESNESNNGRTESITVAGPDLVVDAIWTEPATVIEGENFRIKATIRNQGAVTANAGLFANQEAVFFFDGTQEGEGDDYDNLGPGQTLTVQSPNITGPAPGNYSIQAVSDGNSEVPETNETNNTASDTVRVEPKLSWRSSASETAGGISQVNAGQTVYAHVHGVGSPGETLQVEVWEDDTSGLDILGDDLITTLSVTLDSGGFGTASWDAAWQGDDADGPENNFYLYYDVPFSIFNLSSNPLNVFVNTSPGNSSFANPLVFDWGTSPPLEGVIDVTLRRADDEELAIDPAAEQTWLVIHGRTSNSSNFETFADDIKEATGDQVLLLDWSEGASTVNTIDFSGEAWILPVADWAVQALTDYGFSSSNLNIIGHSWGGVLSGELAGLFPGGVNGLVALDPAEDAPPPVGKFYSTENVNFGGSNSNYSWAFYSRDSPVITLPLIGAITPGSDVSPTTADEAFVVTASSHSAVGDLFRSMFLAPVGTVSRFFSLDRLLAGKKGPWLQNQYDFLGSPGGLYEAVISSTSGGTLPVDITYVPDGTTVADPGDYDQDNDVDGSDFLQWQRSAGTTGANLPADGNFTGTVEQGDLRVWEANYNVSTPPAVNDSSEASVLSQIAAQVLSHPPVSAQRIKWIAIDLAIEAYVPSQFARLDRLFTSETLNEREMGTGQKSAPAEDSEEEFFGFETMRDLGLADWF